uniref:Uncharacterized protein n=1 Tax=Arundo donax TaxID=35708 RepID=A0A0A9AID7_ARUDO
MVRSRGFGTIPDPAQLVTPAFAMHVPAGLPCYGIATVEITQPNKRMSIGNKRLLILVT